MIFPVPVLSYLIAALISGVVFDRSTGVSKTMLAIGAAQWIANGFSAMVLATVLAVVIITVRWFLWRRGRPATRKPDWPVPRAPGPPGPARDAMARRGRRGAPGRLPRNPGIPRASRVRVGRGRAGRRAGPGFLGVLGPGPTRAHVAPALVPRPLVPRRAPEPNLTTSPAGRSAAPGA